MNSNNVQNLVRLIDEAGIQLGVVLLSEARNIARERELELIVVDSKTVPPVAQIADPGQRKYLASKNKKKARTKQHRVEVKEVKMRYFIGANDFQTKLSHAATFLETGFNVQLAIPLRGREIRHADLAVELSKRFIEKLSHRCTCERGPMLQGKVVICLISPISK